MLEGPVPVEGSSSAPRALRDASRDGRSATPPTPTCATRRDHRRLRPAARARRVRPPDLAGADLHRQRRDQLRGQARRILAEVEALHEAIVDGRRRPSALWREKFERWVRDLVELLPEEFDDELWASLTRS
jgi:hypothetical protein